MSISWETGSASAPGVPAGRPRGAREARSRGGAATRIGALTSRLPRPELLALAVLAAALDLWALSRNGWANDYYSAAARSMSSSWHNFLFASMDPSGVMTVDKPPLSLWVQALSVRLFGYHPLSVLVPQALMGVASVALVYDLVRRRFGRLGGFIAGVALATTPIAVAIFRHNNPDALLLLCSVAAVWFAVRGLETGRTRWIVLCGVMVGLGFETKMAVALTVVPGIVAAWLWIAPRAGGWLRALRQLLAGGAAMVAVGGAWPLLVELTPAADRPWVAGTSDNTVLSLIFGYNGLNRVEGQAGVPAGGSMSGESPGVFRLLNSALGGQGGWLLAFAGVSLLGMLAATRLRRGDARTGWLVVVGGAFLVTAALLSVAGGIFHPYYVSLLTPFVAALAGAGAAELARGRVKGRVVGPLAVAGGVAAELMIKGHYAGQLDWLAPTLLPVGALAAVGLLVFSTPRLRLLAASAGAAALLLAPAAWAIDTLGHPANGTFPSGGPASVESGPGGFGRARFGMPFGALRGSARAHLLLGTESAGPPLFGATPSPGAPPRSSGAGAGPGAPSLPGAASRHLFGAAPLGAGPRVGGPFGDGRSIAAVLTYVRLHGGGTIAVSSQSSAAAAIIAQNADVAGIGGFSGRESQVSPSWLAQEVRSGKIRWVLAEAAFGRRGVPGDTRVGSRPVMNAVARACLSTPSVAGPASAPGSSPGTLYDCHGRAAQLVATTARGSTA
jgi:4-amino-4-deoxy-L-arabinose transferase-like glycosyltransferase